MSNQAASQWSAKFPWVKAAPPSAGRMEPRILGLECGWIWMTWAVLEGKKVLGGGVVLNEDTLEPAGTAEMPFVELVTRRMYGLHLAIKDLLDEWSPDWVADWSPNQSWHGKGELESHLDFVYRHGQSQGVVKNLCFQRGVPVFGVRSAESTRVVTANPESTRQEVERVLMEKLSVEGFNPREWTHEDGRVGRDNFAGALAIAYAAQKRIRSYQR